MGFVRKGTWDSGIWSSIGTDYPTLPDSFAPGEILLDAGCHTGGVCMVGAERGATVVGFEANRENHALAVINLAGYPSATVHLGALWRSDLSAPAELLFTPFADPANTGGGSVLFASIEEHWAALSATPPDDTADAPLSSHPVTGVALDDVLTTLGRVRFLKVDVEGAEYPILLTSRRLELVDAIAGEYHEFTPTQMAALAPGAWVGDEPYHGDLLRRTLEGAGFEVRLWGGHDRLGYFSAVRPT